MKFKNLSFWDRVYAGQQADYDLAEAICPEEELDNFVGPSDWSYDPYDASVELKGAPVGWEPSEAMKDRFRALGIGLIYVSREGCRPDSYEGASLYRFKDGQWTYHPNGCGQRTVTIDRRGLWARLQHDANLDKEGRDNG